MGENGQSLFDFREFAALAVRHLGAGGWKIFLVMAGGSLGAASRYGVSMLAARAWGVDFPWGTLMVNLAGCFLIGLIFGLAEHMKILTPNARLFLVTGYMGALTTFSSYSAETVGLGLDGSSIRLGLNMILNNVCGMALTLLGMWMGRLK